MLWLLPVPWTRRVLAAAIAAAALWVELRPDPTVEHPFAAVDIEAGETVGPSNTTRVRVPAGVLPEVGSEGVAARRVVAGEPILPSVLGPDVDQAPAGWVVIEMPVPRGAGVGDEAVIVLADTGDVIDALIWSTTSDDPLDSGSGSVAVAPGHAAKVALSAAEGRAVVMLRLP